MYGRDQPCDFLPALRASPDVLIEIQRDLYHDLWRMVGVPSSRHEAAKSIEKLYWYLEEHADLLCGIIRNTTVEAFGMFIKSIFAESWAEISGLRILKDLGDEDVKVLTLENWASTK